MKISHTMTPAMVVLISGVMVACGGGSGGGTPPAPGTVLRSSGTVSATSYPNTYPFNATLEEAYSIVVRATAGDPDLLVTNIEPTSSGTAAFYGMSMNYATDTPYDVVSFIPKASATVYPWVITFDPSASYTIEVFSNQLTVGAAARNGVSGGDTIYYSFDVVAGTAYKVTLEPTEGDADLGVYSGLTGSWFYTLSYEPTGLLGSSSNTGMMADSVTYVAAASGKHYIAVNPALSASTTGYTIKVEETTLSPDLTVTINGVTENAGILSVNYTVRNDGLAAAGPFNVHFVDDAATAPTEGTTSGNVVSHAGLAAGASAPGIATLSTAMQYGTAYAIVDPEGAVIEGDETNNVSNGSQWAGTFIAPVALNFEDGNVPVQFTMTGDAGWVIDSTTAAGGTYSLRSGTITHSQTSCATLNASNSSSAAFDWKVSSESGFDYLMFYIDGVLQSSISGIAGTWAAVSYPTTLGVHEFKWCYTKDYSVNSGSDAGWIDNITIN